MRLLRLCLERYGRFTNRELAFDPAARVVVVLGPNEAGKTTALAAVADALFGIEERTRFNFLHEGRAMRLSVTVADAQGGELSFARLKRRKAAIVDPSTDAPLPDDCLVPFLGTYDRQAFLDIFGLDQLRLRDGGEKLLAGGGDLAESLLAAAPGLGHVTALRDRLRESAAKVFNPDRRTASHDFYRALDARMQARQRIRENELRVDEVRRLREEAERAAAEREIAVATEIEAGLAAARARALGAAARELRVLDLQRSDRAALGEVPPLPASLVPKIRRLLATLETARSESRRTADEESAAEAACARIVLEPDLLASGEAIEALDGERAAVQKELLSLPNRRAEAADAVAALMRLATGLGLDDAPALRHRMPGPPALARAASLSDRIHVAEERRGVLDSERAALAEQRRNVVDARARLGHVTDPASAKRRLAALDGAEERERALRALDRKLATDRTELAERVSRLGIDADADVLATLALPVRAVAQGALASVRAASEALHRRREALISQEEELAQAGARLAALTAGRPLPTPALVDAARRNRDELWAMLRPLTIRERIVREEDALVAAQLDSAIAAADQVADDRQSETQRLADLARAERDIAELGARIGEARKRAAEAEDAMRVARAVWDTLWRPAGLSPAPDEQALAQLGEIEAIRQMRGALRTATAEARERLEAARIEREETGDLRRELGLLGPGEGPLRIADLRQAVAEVEARFLEARDHEREMQLLERRDAELGLRDANLTQEVEALGREAGEIFPALALRAEATAEEARAALALWREAATCVSDLATAERRIAGIERDAGIFANRLRELTEHLGGQAPADDITEAFATARTFRTRLEAARVAQSRSEAAKQALIERSTAHAAAVLAVRRLEEELADLRAAGGIAEVEGLLSVLDRIERASACEASITEALRRLDDFGGGREEAELRAAVDGQDDEALARRAAEAAARHEAARDAAHRAVEQDTQARGALDALESRTGAAAAAQEEQDALAAVADASERFIRDHVAARLLTLAIERYRDQHNDPIVARASRLFASLTGGRWEGIGVDYDQDPPRLAARREGATFGVSALSEGTRDQLFLALRIAAVEEHAGRATPLPFIADDLFVSFDETRTAAGLSALAELGERTQVIVFTHHRHVADCAERALGAAASIVLLDH